MRRIRNEPAVLLLASVAASVASPPSAGAQAGCAELEWRDGCALPFGFDSDLRAVASLDHDGDGVASLFAAGAGGASGASFEGLAHFVDGAWRPFGGQFFGRASKIAVADLDGDGTASLIVLGALRFALDGTLFSLLEWNGSAWVGRVPGWGLEDAVVLDDDGDGTDTLFASAWYPDASLPSWIVRWNGTGWQSLSTACTITPGGFNPSSIPLAAFDSDGDGREELFATAVVSAGGATIASGMARWDGSTWSDAAGVAPPALLTSGTVRSMCVADVDGDGDAELVAGGELANVPAGSAPQVVAYDGKSWSGVGEAFVRETPGVAQANIRLVSSARVGRGGEPALFAAGSFTRVGATPAAGVVRWDGSAWTGVGWGTTGATQGPFQGLFGHDPDGDADFELVGFGNFITIGSSIVNRVASFDGDAWGPLGLTAGTIGLNGSTRDSAWFDHDGDGHRSLLVAGSPSIGESTGLRDFTSAGDVVVSGLAVLDGPDGEKGFGWEALGHPWPKGIEALLVADLDGDGVESLYAAGNTGEPFAPSVEARSIAFFTPTGSGGIWTPLPGRFGGYVETLAAIDHDLDGAPSLFVGGLFSQVDSLAVGRLARWDGAAWQRFDPGTGGQLVNAAVSFDDDGDGLPSMIVAIGNYDPYSWFHRIRKWTGSAWVPVGAVTQGHVLALQAFDHDGDGVASLFAFGQTSTPGGIAWAQRWHAGAWTPFGPVVDFGWTQAGAGMFAFDDDGDGASSVFMHTTDPFSGIHGGLYRAMGDGWVEVAARLAGGASRARVADPDGDGRASVYLDGGLRARPGTAGSGIGIIDACVAPCPADLDADGLVGALDLAALLSGWGACGGTACPGDLDAGGSIDAIDLALLLGAWGGCP